MRPHAPQERGASAVEYALLLAAIAAVIITAIILLGGHVTTLFDDTCDAVNTETGDSTSCG